MVKILVFDTETTGIGPIGISQELTYDQKRFAEKSLIDKNLNVSLKQWEQWFQTWPRITQLSYIVYDTDNPGYAKIFNKYIDIDESVEIEEGASKVTRIYTTEEDAIRKGVDPNSEGVFILSKIKKNDSEHVVPIGHAITDFLIDFNECEYIVGHNVDFDKKMILSELKRLEWIDEMEAILSRNNFVCTMTQMTHICKINSISKAGKPYHKFPRLSEAYEKLFGYFPTGNALHNAVIDVVICLRIFCKMGRPFNFDVCGTNAEITELINSISSQEFKYSS